MRLRLKLAALAGAAMALFGIPAGAVQQAFLVQNSGWMEPFYTDPQSQLKPLVVAVANAAAGLQDQVFTLAFNQTSGENVSPRLLGSANGAHDIMRQLAPLTVARKNARGTTLADTDFQEAITKTINGPFQGRPGIMWIFTNNKNSPGNDPATAARNRDFYRLLHLEPSITRSVVFPLKMPVQGNLYAAKGLMVYALAYGQEAGEELNRILLAGKLSKVLSRAPARLKPVDLEAVRIIPESIINASNMKVSMGADQRTLVLDVDAASLVPEVRVQASLQNLFYPYVIVKASVDSTLHTAAGNSPVQVLPATVTALAPGASQSIEVRFKLPLEQVPSAWSRQAIAAMGKRVLMPMSVSLGLNGQQLALPDSFKAEMQYLFPGDPISEVFVPPDSVRTSLAQVPLLVRIQYPLLPLLVLMGLLLVLSLALVGLGLLLVRSTRYPVAIDGVPRYVVLKPFKVLSIKNDDGQLVGEIHRRLGRPQVVNVQPGHALILA